MSARMSTNMSIYAHVYARVYVCVYTCVYTHVYTHAYTHAHTLRSDSFGRSCCWSNDVTRALYRLPFFIYVCICGTHACRHVCRHERTRVHGDVHRNVHRDVPCTGMCMDVSAYRCGAMQGRRTKTSAAPLDAHVRAFVCTPRRGEWLCARHGIRGGSVRPFAVGWIINKHVHGHALGGRPCSSEKK